MKRKQFRTPIRILIVIFTVGLLTAAGSVGYAQYQHHLNNKIYAAGETVLAGDLSIAVTNVAFSPVSLSIPEDKLLAFGGLTAQEDCKQYPYLSWQVNGVQPADYNFDENEYEKTHPSARFCEWRNDSRTKITGYNDSHKKLTLNYALKANTNVDSSLISIELLPDSGRDLSKPETQFDFDPLLSERYTPPFDYSYNPYTASALGGTINNGITRKGSIVADIQNNEKIIDFKMTYRTSGGEQTRIIRLNQ
ncbi:MAG: hypothetical protein EOO17_05680 [Chloroflexi bacterium]|nr:MAG: hypothetical protein EOO17_05680 [Chloroflexota bacterium]